MRIDAVPAYRDLVTGHYQRGRGYRSWRPHGSNDWLLILTVDGAGRFGRASSGETVTRPGDLVLLRPGTRHEYGTAPGVDMWELLWTHFQPRAFWADWLRWPEDAPGLMRLSLREPIVRRKITARFQDVHSLAVGALPQKSVFAMNALEEVLLWCVTQNPRAEASRVDVRVQRVQGFIQEHLAEKLALETLATHSGLSPSRLSCLFRAQTGMTPQQYLERQRLTRAQQLLARTTLAVGAVASEVGFDNPFYFTLRFKRHTGSSPTDWRRQIAALETAGADADA